jgi:hypothetical protein
VRVASLQRGKATFGVCDLREDGEVRARLVFRITEELAARLKWSARSI